MFLFDQALLGLALLAAVPAGVFFLECVVALLPFSPRQPSLGSSPSFVVLVPAHNEEEVIADTLRSIQSELSPQDRVVVIADNCTDRTASVAQGLGAEVLERNDPDRRGKGFALAFGVEQLHAHAPDVLIIVDADCQVGKGSLRVLAEAAVSADRPVQAEYLLVAPKRTDVRTSVSALAFLVRNRVRPRGLHRLGLPVHLTGSGMAFPWEVFRKAPPTGSYLVEDMLIGIELALLGHPPLLCPQATITSELPTQGDAAQGQRRRWEHGHLATLLKQGPKLILQGLGRGRLALVALGLDLIVPPLALLVLLLGALGGLTVVAAALGAWWLPAFVAVGNLTLVTVGVLCAWLRFGTHVLPLRHALAIPAYLIWKIPVYLAFFLRRGQKNWNRTPRAAASDQSNGDSP